MHLKHITCTLRWEEIQRQGVSTWNPEDGLREAGAVAVPVPLSMPSEPSWESGIPLSTWTWTRTVLPEQCWKTLPEPFPRAVILLAQSLLLELVSDWSLFCPSRTRFKNMHTAAGQIRDGDQGDGMQSALSATPKPLLPGLQVSWMSSWDQERDSDRAVPVCRSPVLKSCHLLSGEGRGERIHQGDTWVKHLKWVCLNWWNGFSI